jgi:hypothetical protein
MPVSSDSQVDSQFTRLSLHFGESLTCRVVSGLLTNYWLLARSMEQKCNEKLLLLATEALIANGLKERGCSSTFIISSLNSICCQVLGSVCVCVSVCMSECVCTQLLCNSMWCFALLFLCNKMIPSCFLGERRERERRSQ